MTEPAPIRTTDFQLKTQTQKPATRVETLRGILKDLDNRIARLLELSESQALEIPSLFDQAEALMGELQELGTNLSSELGHFNTLSAQFYKAKGNFLRKIGGSQAMENIRDVKQPSSDHWWWFVDVRQAHENKRKALRLLRGLGVGAVLLVILILVYNRFFAPDPAFRASYGLQQRAENALMEGNLENALAEVQEALTYTPDEADLYILQGVILEALEQAEEAQASYEKAIQLLGQEEYLYNQRTILYLMLGDLELALKDAEYAIQLNPDSAINQLHLGQVYDSLGDINKAIESYEKADVIAQETGNAQLQAIIRVSLSYVYQRIPMPTFDTVVPEETESP